MFRTMRRIKQQIPDAEAQQILSDGTTCTLALIGDGGYPYSVPINYVYADGRIYFHCAAQGHKLDALRAEPRVSLSVIARDDIYQAGYTNRYRSVIVFGTARVLTDPADVCRICRLLAEHTCPDAIDGIDAELEHDAPSAVVVEIVPQHITGKEGLELYKQRNAR